MERSDSYGVAQFRGPEIVEGSDSYLVAVAWFQKGCLSTTHHISSTQMVGRRIAFHGGRIDEPSGRSVRGRCCLRGKKEEEVELLRLLRHHD